MSPRITVNRPLVAFCDDELKIWGVCIGGADARLALGPLSGAGSAPGAPDEVPWRPAELAVDGADGDWEIRADGLSLRIAADAKAPDGAGLARCEVSGGVTTDGETVAVGAAGVRCASPPGGKLDSLRLVGAWFGDAHGVTMLAARPGGAHGQDKDAIEVLAYGEAEGVGVFDPRLSTTYDASTRPRRMGIELWLGETEDGDQSPRRVAGESAGPYADAVLDGIRASACPMSCQSRGADGNGIYLLLSGP